MSIRDTVLNTAFVNRLVAGPARTANVATLRRASLFLRVQVALPVALLIMTPFTILNMMVDTPAIPIVASLAYGLFCFTMWILFMHESLQAYKRLRIADGKISGDNLNVEVEYGYDPHFSYDLPYWFKRQLYMGIIDGVWTGAMGALASSIFFLMKVFGTT